MKLESKIEFKMEHTAKPQMEPEVELKGATFSSMWHQFTEDSTLHGLRGTHSRDSHVARKIIWVGVIVIMGGLYFGIAGISIVNYYT